MPNTIKPAVGRNAGLQTMEKAGSAGRVGCKGHAISALKTALGGVGGNGLGKCSQGHLAKGASLMRAGNGKGKKKC